MKRIPGLVLMASLLASLLAPLQVLAQGASDMANGEIRKVDKEAGKLTIRHGEIKSLDMPPMTMVFVMKNPAALDTLKAGDKVQFQVVREDGKMVVTEIQPAP